MRRSSLRRLTVLGVGAAALAAAMTPAPAQQAPMQLGAPLPRPVAAPQPHPAAAPQPAEVGTVAKKPQALPTAAPKPAGPAVATAKTATPAPKPAAKPAAPAKVAAPKPDAAALRAANLARVTGQTTPVVHHHVFETPKPTACPGNPDAIGVSRVMKVDTEGGYYVGQTYQTRLPLEPKEVVLTFDDGPMQGRTERVLEALDKECTKASFFIVGQMAKAYPETLRKTAANGHTIAYHTMTHPLTMVKWPLDKAQANVRDGWQTVDQILYGKAGDAPATPFFRYPGLFNSRALNDWFNGLDMGVWAIDAAGNDWLKGYITLADGPNVMNRALAELEARQGGILLLHDIKDSSSSIVGPLLRELKKRGYRIVHIVPKTPPPKLISGPIRGVVPSIAETTVPVDQRSLDNFDAGKRLAQEAAGRSGKTSAAALPAYDAGRASPATARNAAMAAELPPPEPETTGAIPAARPKPEDGWFSSTAASFRGIASVVGLR
ncbi:MAG: polysaccharide deacetylase family protein [Siculibacillus sp.]|nr:polysaccharide deacetylase family protein [Siculibacillus sp.]